MISDYSERIRRSNANKDAVLNHLALFRFSTVVVLRELLGLSVSGSYKVLSRLEQEQLIRSHVINELGIKVFGLTSIGAFQYWKLEETERACVAFDLARVPNLTLKHELKTQLIKVKVERSGWRNWICERDLPIGLRKYPDGQITSPTGKVYAVECELHVKSHKRLGQIKYAHLKSISEGRYDFVLYFCPDQKFAEKLKVIFDSIKQVTVAGRKVAFDERHHRRFIFGCTETWPKFVEVDCE